jgi:hypothetical protein
LLRVSPLTRNTSEPSIADPPDVVDTSPNGSSFGRRFELSRAINRSSPISGSGQVNGVDMKIGYITCSNIGRHMDDGVTIVHNEIVRQA